MPKPSEQIRNIIPAIAKQRLQKATRANGQLLSHQEERIVLESLRQDPLTWIMSMLTFLDSQAQELERPSTRLRPDLSIDGNQFCVLYGLNLVEGVGGFGDTPELAMLDFDKRWLDAEAHRQLLSSRVTGSGA